MSEARPKPAAATSAAARPGRPQNAVLSGIGTTIFTVMSALAQQHGAINLGQGFPDYDGPPDVIEAAAAALKDGRNQYPPLTGLPELRAAVAAHNRRFYGIEVDPDGEVVVTSGATEAITACLAAVLNPGDEVVLLEPLYDTYVPSIRLLGGIPRLVRLSPPRWELPRAELAAAFGPRTKAILLNTPMNPTGKVFTGAELAFIADLITRHDVYAICDEVYEHLTFDGWRHIPLMSVPGMRRRCMRIGSAGKTFNLTGWKVGYVTCDAGLQPNVAKAHQNLTFTTPPNLQRAVALGLAKDDSYFRDFAADLQAKRDLLATGLMRLGFGVLETRGSYFITTDIRPLGWSGDDMAFCRAITEEAKVTAIPNSAFYAGPHPPDHYVRFAFCKRVPVLEEALARLAAWIGAGRARSAR
ncbi:MAG: aminotransferase, partial [Rhodovarius sp.]|nr:aminotransferase [Rhodovarius sp.]